MHAAHTQHSRFDWSAGNGRVQENAATRLCWFRVNWTIASRALSRNRETKSGVLFSVELTLYRSPTTHVDRSRTRIMTSTPTCLTTMTNLAGSSID